MTPERTTGERVADGLDDLRDALDGFEPNGFEVLSDEQLGVLADRIRATRQGHVDELEAATQESLRHVPRLVRPAIRKALGL